MKYMKRLGALVALVALVLAILGRANFFTGEQADAGVLPPTFALSDHSHDGEGDRYWALPMATTLVQLSVTTRDGSYVPPGVGNAITVTVNVNGVGYAAIMAANTRKATANINVAVPANSLIRWSVSYTNVSERPVDVVLALRT